MLAIKDESFNGTFPFAPHYFSANDVAMHYVDEPGTLHFVIFPRRKLEECLSTVSAVFRPVQENATTKRHERAALPPAPQ